MFIRSAFNYDRDLVSAQTGLLCGDKSKTQQNMKDEADINVIVGRFLKTGLMPQGVRVPEYADFTEVMDFKTAQQVLIDARMNFMQMPANLRARFHNSPQNFLEFCTNKDNLEEMRKLGLAIPEKMVDTTPAPDKTT